MRAEGGLRKAATAGTIAALLLLGGCFAPRDPGFGLGDGPPARPLDAAGIPDAVPRAEPRSKSGNPPFYEVRGRRYYVMNDAAGYRESGIASWYGTKFHGRRTSSGEPYDMYAMTAAHKTLPLPSYVRVTHRGNGRSVVVRVNDRGPFIGDRVIDLSYAAAVRLGMHNEGTAAVDVEIITPRQALATSDHTQVAGGAGSSPEPSWLQVGAFSSEENAARLQARLVESGIDGVVLSPQEHPRQRVYRVRIGPLTAIDEIERTLERVRGLGIRDAHLSTD
ncbi:septal ring lytic transglycosylase RlpA family protein [Wenzhouxiangella sp. XN24]|uniref:septal ring lytic transglycosylase RlpA family protein n=1 Tax=Wenzhouxiangella sp. XN24 TaxID=2713569 RepID=UPI0019814E7D|nr:septal ring lytic transglycosylase RlpA family protein [Wenzhouxiangella sp. XN24]